MVAVRGVHRWCIFLGSLTVRWCSMQTSGYRLWCRWCAVLRGCRHGVFVRKWINCQKWRDIWSSNPVVIRRWCRYGVTFQRVWSKVNFNIWINWQVQIWYHVIWSNSIRGWFGVAYCRWCRYGVSIRGWAHGTGTIWERAMRCHLGVISFLF